MTDKTQHTILVVDDQPINIKLLERKLHREGYRVFTAYNGRECLAAVEREIPDLILLDVMMPEMNGIETCQRLKENEKLETVPIIFITAKSSKEGKLEGLGAGAVDYITKPIDLEETIARVKTQLKIQQIYRENLELQRRLGEARRSAAVGAITQGIAHNLNNMLGVVVGYLDLLKNGYDSPEMVRRSVGLMDQAIDRIVKIVAHLSTIATSERTSLAPTGLADLINGAVERFQNDIREPGAIAIDFGEHADAEVPANVEVFETACQRLFMNAWEAYPPGTKAEDRAIEVKVSQRRNGGKDYFFIEISDGGSGLDEEVAETIFEPFVTSKSSVGRGLGLTMARHAMTNVGGDITIEERRDGPGVVATIWYPVQPEFSDKPSTRGPFKTTAIE